MTGPKIFVPDTGRGAFFWGVREAFGVRDEKGVDYATEEAMRRDFIYVADVLNLPEPEFEEGKPWPSTDYMTTLYPENMEIFLDTFKSVSDTRWEKFISCSERYITLRNRGSYFGMFLFYTALAAFSLLVAHGYLILAFLPFVALFFVSQYAKKHGVPYSSFVEVDRE